jgi:hypothetical protein
MRRTLHELSGVLREAAALEPARRRAPSSLRLH